LKTYNYNLFWIYNYQNALNLTKSIHVTDNKTKDIHKSKQHIYETNNMTKPTHEIKQIIWLKFFIWDQWLKLMLMQKLLKV